ncbi:MAG TPA: helix-turn-helix transcriptional regulator [Clostridiales bacterium]|nr:helix-turn-helix transcriptional regulator [Clostridiales bacterium]
MRNREQLRGNKNICGMRIEYLRQKKGLKQKDLLEALAVQGIEMSSPVLSKIEGQHRAIYDYELLAIANILDVTTDELLGRF